MMKSEHRFLSTPRKLFHSQRPLNSLVVSFLIFGCGLCFGITLSFCFESNPFNLKLVEQLFAIDPPTSPSPPGFPIDESQHLSIDEPPNLSIDKPPNPTNIDYPPNLSVGKPAIPSIDEPPNLPNEKQTNPFSGKPPNSFFDEPKTETIIIKEESIPISVQENVKKEDIQRNIEDESISIGVKENVIPEPQPLLLQHEPQPQPQPHQLILLPTAINKMKDDELFWRALKTRNIQKNLVNRVPKVAFMFLIRGVLPLAPLWDKFFKGHEGLYSIYLHTQPLFKGEVAHELIFQGRRIRSKKVEWGKISMVEAERRLLANALLDTSNERFVLLSEACIPLYNFTTIYSYLMDSNQTFVESYDLPGPVGRGRYNSRMQPTVKLEQWRKGSQWFEVDRTLAFEIISDRKYFPLFRRYCRPACYSDEHYIPTYISIKFWKMNSNRTLTWVDWSKGGPHPNKFGREDVTPEFLQGMRISTECLYNGKPSNMCFLFARKFMPSALTRLLELAPRIMNFNY